MSRGPMPDDEIEQLREYLKNRKSNWREVISARQGWQLILRIDRLRQQLTALQQKARARHGNSHR